MKIAILGFGREGKSLLRFLKKSPKYKEAEIEILDQKDGPDYLKSLSRFDLAFRSPGVPYNLPEIQSAIKNGVAFSSLTKLFFDLCAVPIIGVTGTKGKGTTSTLIYQILKRVGRKVLLAGNIGKPALEILPKIDKNTSVILELSSFQLQDLRKSPQVAVITELFPDHMDIHKNMAEYLGAKTNICRHQKKSDVVFYFANNKLSGEMAFESIGKKIAVVAPDTLEKNRVLASTVARYLGCPENIIQKTLKKFRGLEHRLEFVREINGIRFYNDSASTNPQTTAAAISSLATNNSLAGQAQLILIAGGKDKNLDYQPLADAIQKSGQVKLVVLIGENKEKIKQALPHAEAPLMDAKRLELAVKAAYEKAKSLSNQVTNSLITILFSPGAASFDMFKDYADRGEKYKKAVHALKA